MKYRTVNACPAYLRRLTEALLAIVKVCQRWCLGYSLLASNVQPAEPIIIGDNEDSKDEASDDEDSDNEEREDSNTGDGADRRIPISLRRARSETVPESPFEEDEDRNAGNKKHDIHYTSCKEDKRSQPKERPQSDLINSGSSGVSTGKVNQLPEPDDNNSKPKPTFPREYVFRTNQLQPCRPIPG